jgi:hypothetical protein
MAERLAAGILDHRYAMKLLHSDLYLINPGTEFIVQHREAVMLK